MFGVDLIFKLLFVFLVLVKKPFHFHKITIKETFLYSLNDFGSYGETSIHIST
jgi:hypothetical protein